MIKTRILGDRDWPLLRDIRLQALKDSPHALVGCYAREVSHGEGQWRQRLRDCTWLAAFEPDPGGRPVGVIAMEWDTRAATECHIGSLWVTPGLRLRGIRILLVDAILELIAREGARSVSLWVLDGNASARALYERKQFKATGERQRAPGRSHDIEERMRRRLL